MNKTNQMNQINPSRLSRLSRPSRGISFRLDEPPTQRPNDGADCIGQPVLPARLAEWDKELMRFIRHPVQGRRDDGEEERVRRHLPAHAPAEGAVAEHAKAGVLHRVQDFVADVFEQERWQIIFRVRLGRQVKNRTGIQRHRHPVPEHLNHHTLPSCVTHRFPYLSLFMASPFYCRPFTPMTYWA